MLISSERYAIPRNRIRFPEILNASIVFAGVILILSMLVGCKPSREAREAVDYSPQPGDDWEVSIPEEQGLDPMQVAAHIPLAEAAQAHELLARGRYAGKVVLIT